MTPADPIIAEVTASFAAEEFLGGKPWVEPNPLIIAAGTIAEKAVRSPLLHQRLEVPPDGQSVKIFREVINHDTLSRHVDRLALIPHGAPPVVVRRQA